MLKIRRNAFALQLVMKTTAQKLPVENWESGPELHVVRQNEATGGNGSNGSSSTKIASLPRSRRLSRPELAILSWDHRSERLIRRPVAGK
jgi:hypothetical protein